MKTCFFTGHRSVKLTPELSKRLIDTLEMLIESGVTDFYAGGAIGWDTICAECVLALRKRFPQIKLHLVLPCPPEIQTAAWSSESKARYYGILNAADSAEQVSTAFTNDCMKKRNARLAELGDICICYFDEKRPRSGTGQTVRMAQKNNAGIIDLFMSGDGNR